MIDAGDTKNGRSAMQQGQVVAENIVRAIRGKKQIEYRQKWWEGLTKLTMGLVRSCLSYYLWIANLSKTKSVAYISDGRAELVIPVSSKIELDSERVWKFFRLTPYVDPAEKN